jgi:hypothetical protein
LLGSNPPDDGLALPLFAPDLEPEGATLTKYRGGRSLGQLIEDLRERDAATATLSLPDGSTATVVVTDLEFVHRAFVASFLGIKPDEVDAALTSMGVGRVLEVQIPPGTLMFVRSNVE